MQNKEKHLIGFSEIAVACNVFSLTNILWIMQIYII